MRRVSGPISHPSCPFTPTSSDDTGSKPSCGRVKFVFCDCWTAMKLSSPFLSGSVDVMPKSVVGVTANSGFSSNRTVTARCRLNSVSGRAKLRRPSS